MSSDPQLGDSLDFDEVDDKLRDRQQSSLSLVKRSKIMFPYYTSNYKGLLRPLYQVISENFLIDQVRINMRAIVFTISILMSR